MQATRRVPFLTIFTALLTLTGAPGCDAPDEDLEAAVEFRPGGGFACSWCSVYGNSPNINGAALADINFDLINTNGVNTAGVKLRNAKTMNIPSFQLGVDPTTERFLGIGLGEDDLGSVILENADMIGAKLWLELPNDDEKATQGLFVELDITAYDPDIPSWSKGGKPITAYKAQYVDSHGAVQDLCPDTNPDNQWFTLILGETYEPAVNPVVARPGSVTLACVGEAAAKMKLMDYGPHGNREASEEERAATLHMITASYCGDGHSFTTSGTAVAWRNDDDTVLPPFAEIRLEAKWGLQGAQCISEPRYAGIGDVLARCSIPICEGEDFIDGTLWRTMLP